MSLFSAADIKLPNREETKTLSVEPFSDQNPAELHISVRGQKAIDTVPELLPGRNYYFPSFGAFSSHDVMLAVVNQCGASDLFFCTWAFSEEPVRAIMKLHDVGLLKSVKAILNYRAKQECPAAFQLFKSNYPNYCFDKTHAKIMVIKGEKLSATIFGSANLTVNPRNEFYCINTQPDFLEYNLGWMNEIFTNNHENI